MDDMVDRCMDAMGSMMGSGMMGNGIILVVLLRIFLVWLVGLATGALIFWGVRRFTRACYEPTPRMPVACWRKRQAKATKCSPATVAGSLS
jgi:hypothetical protein